jgi:hypothetical protein
MLTICHDHHGKEQASFPSRKKNQLKKLTKTSDQSLSRPILLKVAEDFVVEEFVQPAILKDFHQAIWPSKKVKLMFLVRISAKKQGSGAGFFS